MKINNEAINKIAPNLNHLTDEQKQLIDRIKPLQDSLHDGPPFLPSWRLWNW